MALEPGGRRDQLVTGSSNGELKFVDLRKLGGEADPRGGNMGVWQRVEAHSKGSVTALAAHPNAPLLATGTNTQVEPILSVLISCFPLVSPPIWVFGDPDRTLYSLAQ